jgi:hypothetical protein
MPNLAALVSSKTSATPIDAAANSLSVRINANLKSEEYLRCLEIFKGYLVKPVVQIGRRGGNRKPEEDRIDFSSHVTRMIDWLLRYSHSENMAPALWDYAKAEIRPILGTECRFDETIIKDLCKFYLVFHDEKKPF